MRRKKIIIKKILITFFLIAGGVFVAFNIADRIKEQKNKEPKKLFVRSNIEKFDEKEEYTGCAKKKFLDNKEIKVVEDKDVEKYSENISTSQWKKYENKILGIKFSYPVEWGDPRTGPESYITNLEELRKRGDSNFFNESIYISFTKKDSMNLRLFSSDYPGEYFPHADAIDKKIMLDNVDVIKKGEDICKYRINNYYWTGYVMEVDSICHDNMKIALIETPSLNVDTGCMLGYHLEHIASAKLNNGFFDNVLIMERFPYLRNSINNPVANIQEYVKQGSDEKEYAKKKSQFNAFAKTVEAIDPQDDRIMDIQITENDNKDTLLIRQYYLLIQKGELQEAFDMKTGGADYEEFKKSYENAYTVFPRDFERIGDKEYKFRVDYQDKNDNSQIYHTVMKVVDGKLSTKFVERMDDEVIVNDKLRGYIVKRGNTQYVIVEKNGREIIVDSSFHDPEEEYGGSHFVELNFYDSNKFVKYGVFGWEWYGERLFDLSREKNVLRLSSPFFAEFNKSNEAFFACALSHFGGELYVDVYDTENFEKKFSLFNEGDMFDKDDYFIDDMECEYEKNKDILNISLTAIKNTGEFDRVEEKYEWEYLFFKNKLRKIK